MALFYREDARRDMQGSASAPSNEDVESSTDGLAASLVLALIFAMATVALDRGSMGLDGRAWWGAVHTGLLLSSTLTQHVEHVRLRATPGHRAATRRAALPAAAAETVGRETAATGTACNTAGTAAAVAAPTAAVAVAAAAVAATAASAPSILQRSSFFYQSIRRVPGTCTAPRGPGSAREYRLTYGASHIRYRKWAIIAHSFTGAE
jgi:hypothetical protein